MGEILFCCISVIVIKLSVCSVDRRDLGISGIVLNAVMVFPEMGCLIEIL
jgi:hypothetical protein